MSKRAQCQCGALAVEIEGPEEAVVMCSCTECQRRSGSPFGEGAYYQRGQVRFIGEAREYVRAADSGKPFHQFFCPTCATTLYFWSERDPNRVGVAVGAFADSDFRRPDRSVFDSRKHAWVTLPADMPGFTRGRDSERTR
jgi:hypothetical protein